VYYFLYTQLLLLYFCFENTKAFFLKKKIKQFSQKKNKTTKGYVRVA